MAQQLSPFGDPVEPTAEEAERVTQETEQARQTNEQFRTPMQKTGDRFKAVASGVRDLLVGTLGLPGDAASIAGNLVEGGAGLLPDKWVDPATAKRWGQNTEQFLGPAPGLAMPGSADIQKTITEGLTKDIPEALPAVGGASRFVENVTNAPQTPGSTEDWFRYMTPIVMPGFKKPNLSRGVRETAEDAGIQGVRMATPIAAEVGTDAITQAMVENGDLTPESAAAITMLSTGAGIKGGATFGKALEQRQAATAIGTNPKALRALNDALIRDGHTPESAKEAMTQMGLDATLMDVGDNLLQQGIKAATTPGAGQTAVKRALEGREERTGARLKSAKEEAFDRTEVNRDTIMRDLDAKRRDINKDYPAAHRQQQAPVDTQDLINEIDSQLGVAKDKALRGTLETIRENLHLRGTDSMDPSSEGLHAAREAIDNQLYDANGNINKNLGSKQRGALEHYRKQINDALSQANPAVREVDKRFSDVAKEKEAFATGEEVLKKGGQPQSPAEFKTTWDAMTEPERQQAVSGAARYVEDTLGLTDRERSRLKTVLGGDYNEAKLRTMIGDEKAQAFMDAMQREDVFSNTRNKVVHGSRTLEGLEEPSAPGLFQGAASSAAGAGLGGGGFGGMGIAAASQIGRNALAKLQNTGKASQKLRSDVGLLLASDRPDDVIRGLKELQAAGGEMSKPMILALLARQEELGNR